MSVFGAILVLIFPEFSRIRTEYGAYLFVFSPNAGKCRKNADQNNSEYGLFLRSAIEAEKNYQIAVKETKKKEKKNEQKKQKAENYREISEAYSELGETSMIKYFAKIVLS